MFVPDTFIITFFALVARVHGAKNQPKTPSAGSNDQPGENTQVTTLNRPTDALFVPSPSEYRTSVASTVSSSASVATPSLSPPGKPFQKPVNIAIIVKPESLIGGEVANAWYNDLSYYQTYDGDKTDELEGKNTDGEEGDRDDDEKKGQRDRELAYYDGHLKLGEMKYSRLFSMGRKFVWQQKSEDPKVLIKVSRRLSDGNSNS
jgi:hypothetical protein